MNSQLVRVQAYLDPQNLEKIDEIARGINISRSQIIRDALAAVANGYIKTINLLTQTHKPKIKTWLELAGVEESKTGDLGLRVDEIYNG